MSQINNASIVSTRTFHHPREQIFEAFADPEILSRWWGPRGNTNTFHVFDFVEGGKWVFTMHSDGVDYPNEMIFRKIEENHLILEHTLPHFFLDISLEELSDSEETKMTWDAIWDSPEILAKIADFLREKNAENFDRLEQELG